MCVQLVLREDALLLLRPLEPLSLFGVVAVLREEAVHAHRKRVALLRCGGPLGELPPGADVLGMRGVLLMVMLLVVLVTLTEESVFKKLERVQDAHRALHHLLAARVDVDDVLGAVEGLGMKGV